ncbi:DUF547 domain-containing protein [Halobacterium bonnevillei]|uniref:DUF547 domain-containing protein n=1 Tax=Halobacterium bonnevillei TaxID=2692200 RepID=A0A6B0SJM3_9EURY|nr:DUF547 domain-containing protein [Halobacterium bonnevillei]MXR19723.1 DUF547 domain-containing protein [Halobacterium bonnevillei]
MSRVFAANADTTTPHDLVAASQRLLHAVHHGNRTDDLFTSLARLDESVLAVLGDDDRAAKAFWLNIHGALAADAADAGRRVAGMRLDPETVYHGILRGGKWRYGFGYLQNPFQGRFGQRHALDDLDERIHFAVLAAQYAPQLSGTYTATDVNAELTEVTADYLDGTVEYDASVDVAHIPAVFFWHRGDFDGRSGVRAFLVTHGALPTAADPRFSYAHPDPDLETSTESRPRRERTQ